MAQIRIPKKNTKPSSPKRRSGAGKVLSVTAGGVKTGYKIFRKLPLKTLFKTGIFLGVWLVIVGFMVGLYYLHDIPNPKTLLKANKSHTIRYLAADGSLLAVQGNTYGDELNYEEFPPQLIQAVMAIEDRRFFNHYGVDPIGIMRAMVVNLTSGRVVQGGSTLTQQLAKISFLKPDRTIKRKIQELILALWLEYKYSKEEIISMYLNRVYLGGGYYGVDAAAHGYFDKSARWLNLGESAMLAGLLKAPSRYSPFSNPELSKQRANQVIESMIDAGYITEKDKKVVTMLPRTQPKGNSAYYFIDWIAARVPDYVGNVEEDLTVVTTLNPNLQNLAASTLKKWMDDVGKKQKASQAAFVAMSPTGEIRVMVGGKDYLESQYNRAVEAHRQPGSSFKFFVYLTAMEQGFSPSDIFVDEPISIGGWEPKNYLEQFNGEMRLREAFAQSINTIAAQLIMRVGVREVMKTAYRLGIESPLAENASLALGTSEVTLLEMTQAYAHMANNGRSLRAYGITEIQNSHGEVLYRRSGDYSEQVISPSALVLMNQMLMAVLQEGTAKFVNIDRPAAGKTGTSQDFRDAWFIGYTPDIVVGIWAGNDDNSPMKKVTGAALPGHIWQEFMNTAFEGVDSSDIPTSTGMLPFIDEENQIQPSTNVPMDSEEKKKSFWDRILSGNKPEEEVHPNAFPVPAPNAPVDSQDLAPPTPGSTPGQEPHTPENPEGMQDQPH
ncbi:MAG: PBP1A family penicillin-binding protein [Proteobacteria bacterium]|nr:PBP1A family penicillin-binding protein [Pseudomonadota bacterium]